MNEHYYIMNIINGRHYNFGENVELCRLFRKTILARISDANLITNA